MRKSQVALLGGLGVVVVFMVAAASWVRLSADPAPALSGERASRSYDYTGFNGVKTEGQWQVEIQRGDAWSVAVEVPAELVDRLEVGLKGGQLSLEYSGGWCPACSRDENIMEARITMPALESLEVSGASKLSFSGFAGNALAVEISGAVELRGAASRFETVSLDLSGASSVDLSDVPATNADVDISGAGNVQLRMAGGRLTGDLSGAANLEYAGPVSEERIDRSGFVNVRRRD